MTSREYLEQETGIFFGRHWDAAAIPAWDFSWNWCGPVPNHEHSGVYALFCGETLIYIGLGASRDHGSFKKNGIGKRLLAHVLEMAPADSDVSYLPEERWRNAAVDSVATIGFPQEMAYLACALEHYLIEKLNPLENHIKHCAKGH